MGSARAAACLLLSDENLEKLLLWFGIWRLGAVVSPLNIETNEKVLADLAPVVNPALILHHNDIAADAWWGTARRRRLRFGAWSPQGAIDPRDQCFAGLPRGHSADLPERNDPEDIACHILHLRHHEPAQDRRLRSLRLLAQRALHLRIPRPYRA